MREENRQGHWQWRLLFYDTMSAAVPDLDRSTNSSVIPGRRAAANPESRDSPMRNCASEVWSFGPSRNDSCIKQKKRPACASLFRYHCIRSAAMAAMMVMPAAAPEPVRLQLDAGNAGCDVQSGLALHADRLQRVGIRRAADQK